jgi:pimeloyl-ACP methyl ester carboxylesterase
MVNNFVSALVGPRLFRVSDGTKKLEPYQPNGAEYIGDSVMSVLFTGISFTRSAWFLVVPYMYARHYFTREGGMYLFTLSQVVAVILLVAFVARGAGRVANDTYMLFIQHLLSDVEDHQTKKVVLSEYSYEFSHWPVDLDVRNLPADALKEFKPTFNLQSLLPDRSMPLKFLLLPYDLMCQMIMHIIGRRMIYPGSMHILNSLVREHCENARATMFNTRGDKAERFKVRTVHGNDVDTFFVDNRGSSSSGSSTSSSRNGQKLVLCCEGNGGFYEIGILTTPLAAGFSVLGWNHPGFGGSSGLPWPQHETAAVDAVFKFGTTQLGFAEDDIVIFAWSIGGFSATWLAMNYPNVHAVMIDASFDDLIPLAVTKMPKLIEGMVETGIRSHMDLRVSEQLIGYNGPVKLYRRTRDEIITTVDARDIGSNRGNDLALQLLTFRYPEVFGPEVLEYIKKEVTSKRLKSSKLEAEEDISEEVTTFRFEEVSRLGNQFPSTLGASQPTEKKTQLALYLVKKYVVDLDEQHCTPLPPSLFSLPELI